MLASFSDFCIFCRHAVQYRIWCMLLWQFFLLQLIWFPSGELHYYICWEKGESAFNPFSLISKHLAVQYSKLITIKKDVS